MVKSAQPGESRSALHALPLSLYLPSLAKLWFYGPAERADTLPLFLLFPFYVLCGPDNSYRVAQGLLNSFTGLLNKVFFVLCASEKFTVYNCGYTLVHFLEYNQALYKIISRLLR
jgi:hypothetical protein